MTALQLLPHLASLKLLVLEPAQQPRLELVAKISPPLMHRPLRLSMELHSHGLEIALPTSTLTSLSIMINKVNLCALLVGNTAEVSAIPLQDSVSIQQLNALLKRLQSMRLLVLLLIPASIVSIRELLTLN